MLRGVLAILAGVATLTVISFGIEGIANPLLMRLFPASLPSQAAVNRIVALAMTIPAACSAALSLPAGPIEGRRSRSRAPPGSST